jgi:hypothetical protein
MVRFQVVIDCADPNRLGPVLAGGAALRVHSCCGGLPELG